ncbi:hypothetical protein MIDIC_110021 [Alphaproteobacteria bacterium]
MKITNVFTTVVIAMTIMALTGCSESVNNKLKNTVGLNQKAPDEFTVISYPPLSIPPVLQQSQDYKENGGISEKVEIGANTEEGKSKQKRAKERKSPQSSSIKQLLENN